MDINIIKKSRHINKITKFSFACPTQWIGNLSDGRFLYIRYRNGTLSIGINYKLDVAYRLFSYVFKYKDITDGCLTEQQMITIMEQLNFSFDDNIKENLINNVL
jgi:hypothetical protein